MRRSGFEPEFRRWQRLVITATLSTPALGVHLLPITSLPKNVALGGMVQDTFYLLEGVPYLW
jgi:hypothetical protein